MVDEAWKISAMWQLVLMPIPIERVFISALKVEGPGACRYTTVAATWTRRLARVALAAAIASSVSSLLLALRPGWVRSGHLEHRDSRERQSTSGG